MDFSERKQQVIDVCLETFTKKGFAHTSTRDLCDALNLNSGGIFYYFQTKDEIILACAEAAAIKMESKLVSAALSNIENPQKMIDELMKCSTDFQPTMKFFVSVCATSKYQKAIQPILENLTKRYGLYAKKIAEAYCCDFDEIEPYVYITINTLFNYMMFGQREFTKSQLKLICKVETALLERRNQG